MRALAILGAVAALLAAYLLFFDRLPRDQLPGAEAARLVAPFDRATVRRVTVARAGEPAFDLVRAHGGWRVEPGAALADGAGVEDLISVLAEADSSRAADLPPAAAGLEPPRVTLTVDAGQRAVAIRLGNPDASGRGVFAQRAAGDPVRVGPRRLLQLADRPSSAFRDQRALPFSPDAVVHLAWRAGPRDRDHVWDRTHDRWKNAAGERLSSDRVGAALRLVAALRTGSPGPDGGQSAGDGAWIEARDGTGTAVRVRSDEVSAAALDEVWRALGSADLPDRRLLPIPADRIRRIALEEGDRRLVLVRDGTGQPWRFGPLEAANDVEQSAVEDWLARLAATDVVAPAAGPATTLRRLVINDDGEDAVVVGPQAAAYALLAPDPLRFQSRKVLDFAHFDVRELKRSGGGVTFDAASADGEAWTSRPPGLALDAAVVARIAGTLGNLRAESFRPGVPSAAPVLALDVAVQPPGTPTAVWHRVQLWDGCVGRADEKLVFTLARRACAELRLDPRR